MYKLLLCQRYLRTRYIALASIFSVMLGVATMIVVNSVMAGFKHEMYQRLHGILSDVVIECHSMSGFADPQWHMEEIRKTLGSDVVGMTPTVHVPAMINFQYRGKWITRQVNLIGIDEETYAQVGDFSQYLLHPQNRDRLRFLLRYGGYDSRLPSGGWGYRRQRVQYQRAYHEQLDEIERSREIDEDNPSDVEAEPSEPAPEMVHDPFAKARSETAGDEFNAMKEQHTGIILGISIGSMKHRTASGEAKEFFFCLPGDDVTITFPTAGIPPKPAHSTVTIVDFYESKMSEYDSTFAFIPLEKLQYLRGMIDPQTGIGNVTSIQIKLKEGADLNAARDKLEARFPASEFSYRIQTWRQMQGPLLAAVKMETTILNILLFLIIAVAGFGILATFYMIVVEKTRDIGILKSLGAPSRGIMSIFLSYGLSLGVVGSGVGMVLGLLFVVNINNIAALMEWFTGRELFDPTVYYFQEIPTLISPFTIAWIVLGAVTIAVMASILPAIRAARLHPVEALRHE